MYYNQAILNVIVVIDAVILFLYGAPRELLLIHILRRPPVHQDNPLKLVSIFHQFKLSKSLKEFKIIIRAKKFHRVELCGLKVLTPCLIF